ncbi:MAG: hypothetical protein PHI24_15160 [Desulfitobacteriaceae bacterium]|nr:hypothetical protein [Desulfitobacteriaceae bacterium]
MLLSTKDPPLYSRYPFNVSAVLAGDQGLRLWSTVDDICLLDISNASYVSRVKGQSTKLANSLLDKRHCLAILLILSSIY